MKSALKALRDLYSRIEMRAELAYDDAQRADDTRSYTFYMGEYEGYAKVLDIIDEEMMKVK